MKSPARFAGGAAEGVFERATERAFAFKAQCVGDLADRQSGAAYQLPRALMAEARGVLAGCFAKHAAIDADQVGGRVIGDGAKAHQVQAVIEVAADLVLHAQQPQQGLVAAQCGTSAAACELVVQPLLVFDQRIAKPDHVVHHRRLVCAAVEPACTQHMHQRATELLWAVGLVGNQGDVAGGAVGKPVPQGGRSGDAQPPARAAAGDTQVAIQPELQMPRGQLPGGVGAAQFQHAAQYRDHADPAGWNQQAGATTAACDGVDLGGRLARQFQRVDAMEVMMLDSHFASIAGRQPAMRGRAGNTGRPIALPEPLARR